MLCWGNASYGQLGLGGIDEEIVLEPRKCEFFEGKRVRDVGCGRRHSVFLLEDGTVYTCGCNDLGQLGHDKARKKPEQVMSLDAQNIVAVSCGEAHTLALNDKGQVFAWGLGSDGQLGLSNIEDRIRIPRTVKSLSEVHIAQVACGNCHSLALARGQIFSWGQNKYGQLGLGMQGAGVSSPQVVQSLQGVPFAQISAGGAHSFGLTLSGAVFGWGRNKFGQLGLSDNDDRCFPALLKTLRSQRVVYISCGEDHTAVLTKEGGVFTFGAGGYGQLGHNTTNNEVNPRKVFELMGSVVAQIACGRQHTLAFIPSSGKIDSFGLGGNGQLGTRSTCNRISPAPVKGCWRAHTDPVPVDVEAEQSFCVKRIYAGGDQSFAHYALPQDDSPPVDRRITRPDGQIYTLSDDLIQKWLNHGHGRLSPEITNEIDLVFSSASCLNGSFLSGSNPDHYSTNSKCSGVDINTARLLYHRLIQPDYPQISQIVAASLEKNLLPRLNSSPPDIEALRLYLTLPECPLLSNPNNYTTLTIPFAKAVVSLKDAPLRVLGNWWSKFEPAVFQRLVELYKEVVVYLLRMQKLGIPLSEQRIFTCFLHTSLKFLEILHSVNERAGQIIQYDKFYIHELDELIDIRNDYVTWFQQQIMFASVTMCKYPFVFDAQAKTALLQTDAVIQMQMAVDQAQRQNLHSLFASGGGVESVNPCLILIVRRENVVGDSMEVLRKSKNVDYKKPLKVIFVGEEAVDAGGVRKEFFLLIMKELLDPKYGMFRYYEESRLIWFAHKTFEDIDLFHLIGVVCGLAIYNLTIVELNFPLALYKKLLKKTPTLEDLKELMPDVGRSLQQLLDYTEDDLEEAFCLNFTIIEESFGTTEVLELVPNGTDISVNKSNRQEFVNAYVDYIFNTSVAPQFSAFYAGFHKVCGGKVLELFQPSELQAMVIGNTNYDWKELEKSTEYKGEYWADHPTIKIFWEVFHELPLEKKKQFLLFLTGSDRIPILGMKSLALVIQPTGGGEDYFPVAHTCFNLLDLPKYTNKETLKEKLLHAIEHTQGFNLV
uniref:HECT and RLD domain containing E3 ubiquitin protein ligase 4 n=1 Tax=Cyprinus carpio TaxID=7962 RepID=A0A8C2BQY9_CYPCA